MRIISSNSTQLSLQWRAIRLAITTVVILMASLFVKGSVFPVLRPSCCIADMGISCSSCGITRSITSILHGDFESSKAFHQGGIFLVTLVAVSLVSRPLPYLFPSSKFIALDALAFVIAWIILSIIFFGAPGSGYRGIQADGCRISERKRTQNQAFQPTPRTARLKADIRLNRPKRFFPHGNDGVQHALRLRTQFGVEA